MNTEQIVISTAYLPPIEYFAFIAKSEVFFMESAETYQKQSYRSRANILTANGVQSLIIPIVHETQRALIRDVRIDYTCRWQLQHWRTIESAYSNSPYFLYYRDFLSPFYEKKYPFLFDFNWDLLQVLLKLFKINTESKFTEDYEHTYPGKSDLRTVLQKKKGHLLATIPYTQVFGEKFPFTPNLSIIDLLFNCGGDQQYLEKIHSQSNI